MAWSWSHTAEAYTNARAQLEALDRETKVTIAAEWLSQNKTKPDHIDIKRYKKSMSKAQRMPEDVLHDFIWEKMEALATCTNGGWEAWCCPFGCMCHMVPFDPVEAQEEAAHE